MSCDGPIVKGLPSVSRAVVTVAMSRVTGLPATTRAACGPVYAVASIVALYTSMIGTPVSYLSNIELAVNR